MTHTAGSVAGIGGTAEWVTRLPEINLAGEVGVFEAGKVVRFAGGVAASG